MNTLPRNEQVIKPSTFAIKLGEKKDIYMKFNAMVEPKIIPYK